DLSRHDRLAHRDLDAEAPPEVGHLVAGNHWRGAGPRRRRPGKTEEGAELAEVLPGVEDGNPLLAPVGTHLEDLDLPGLHHVDQVPPRPLVEQDLSGVELHPLRRALLVELRRELY